MATNPAAANLEALVLGTNPWQLRLPDQFHPHSLEVRIPHEASSSNWQVRCQEAKSGAARGCSPTWYGFKPADYVIARAIANVPQLIWALELLVESHERLERERGSQVGTLSSNARKLLREIGGAS